MANITFKPGNSIFHKMNPLIKGLVVLFFILFFSLSPYGLPGQMVSLSVLFFLGLAGGYSFKDVLVSLKSILFLLLVVGFLQGAARNGFDLILAIEAILKIVGVFIVAGIFVSTSSQSELMYFWEVTLKPFSIFGLPVKEMSLVMVIAVRFMPVIFGEIERIKLAQTARGANFGKKNGVLSAVKNLMPLLIPTLTISMMRANELALAMESRGYSFSQNRSRYKTYRVNSIDFAFSISIMMLLIVHFFLL